MPRLSQRWDGGYKYFTKNCIECDYYRVIEGESLCGKGKAFTYLVKTENRRKCNIKDRDIEDSSVNYLDKLIKNPKREKHIQLKISFLPRGGGGEEGG